MQEPEGPKGREEPDDVDEASLPNGSEEEGQGDRILECVMHGGWTLVPGKIEKSPHYRYYSFDQSRYTCDVWCEACAFTWPPLPPQNPNMRFHG